MCIALRHGESTDSAVCQVRVRPLGLSAALCDGSKRQTIEPSLGIPTRQVRPVTRPVFSLHNCFLSKTTIYGGRTFVPLPGRRGCNFFSPGKPQGLQRKEITLSGGSLGSCVDEERSQLRELM